MVILSYSYMSVYEGVPGELCKSMVNTDESWKIFGMFDPKHSEIVNFMKFLHLSLVFAVCHVFIIFRFQPK